MSLRRAILIAVLASVPAGSAQVGRPPSQPAGSFPTSGSPQALLQHPDVQKELKLGGRQIQKINEITRAAHDRYQGDLDKLRDLGPAERRRKQVDLAETVSQETMKALSQVLEPGQARRLDQIYLQQQGLRAFADPKVEKALRLTDAQKNKLKMIGEDAAKEARTLFRAGAPSSFEETLKKVAKVGKRAVEQGIALLTDEQKKAWHELIGEALEVTSEPPLIRQPGRELDKPDSAP